MMVIDRLYKTKINPDIIVIINGDDYHLNKNVIAKHSEYFEKQFKLDLLKQDNVLDLFDANGDKIEGTYY